MTENICAGFAYEAIDFSFGIHTLQQAAGAFIQIVIFGLITLPNSVLFRQVQFAGNVDPGVHVGGAKDGPSAS